MPSARDVARFKRKHPELCEALVKEAWEEIDAVGTQLVEASKLHARAERLRCGTLVALAERHGASLTDVLKAIAEGLEAGAFLELIGVDIPPPDPSTVN